MNKSIELCGIKLGDTFDENKFKVVKKQTIPGGDYMSEIAKPSLMGRMQSTSTYFKNVNLVHSIGSKEISMIIADNGGGYSRKDCLDIINELNDYYLDKYVTQAFLGNHDGFQYIITLDSTQKDIAIVQANDTVLSNGERVVIIYGDNVRVLPYEG